MLDDGIKVQLKMQRFILQPSGNVPISKSPASSIDSRYRSLSDSWSVPFHRATLFIVISQRSRDSEELCSESSLYRWYDTIPFIQSYHPFSCHCLVWTPGIGLYK